MDGADRRPGWVSKMFSDMAKPSPLDGHSWAEPRNFHLLPDKGLQLVDYGSRGDELVIRAYLLELERLRVPPEVLNKHSEEINK